jgi:hypothetical protein
VLSQPYGKWWLDSCAAITRASYVPLVLRGGLWAPINWGGGVGCGAAIGVGVGKPIVFNICCLGQKCYISHELVGRRKRRSMLNSWEGSSATATSEMAWL